MLKIIDIISLNHLSEQINIYLAFSILIIGIIANLLNILLFINLGNHKSN